MRKIMKILCLLPLIITFNYNIARSYHHGTTHRKINENAVKQLVIEDKLKNNLCISAGFDKKYNGKKIIDWVIDGGEWEDNFMPLLSPGPRPFRHFHDPLKDWNSAGLSGFDSSLVWAQNYSPYSLVTNDYSWPAARGSFYDALVTGSEGYYAHMFRSLGQLMHLVSDAAVPSHVRNDSHPGGYGTWAEDLYEKWAKKNVDKEEQGIINYTGQVPDPSIFNRAKRLEDFNPISALWDQNTYIGSNPQDTWASDLGLAEFTNANFFSQDTVNSMYPNPDILTLIGDAIPVHVLGEVGEDGKLDNVEYILHPTMGYRLATVSFFKRYFASDIAYLSEDDNVWQDYAEKLIPRAVGYSTALLKYFFRGEIEITAPDSFLYGIIDGSISPHQFTSIKAKVRNTTPDEAMQEGSLVAVAKYKKRIDYEEDLSTDPPQSNSREENYSYSVSSPVEIESLSELEPEEFTFDFTGNPIPAGITDLYLQVVFKGTLGNEKDIAVAVGMKDLVEPTHFTTWNSTDRVYINDSEITGRPWGILVTGQNIRDNPTYYQAADFAEIFIDAHPMTKKFGFFPLDGSFSTYQAVFEDLPAKRYGRVILLTDTPTFSMRTHTFSSSPSIDKITPFTVVSSAINQDDVSGEFKPTQPQKFRTVNQHLWIAYTWFLGTLEGADVAAWPVPENKDPFPATEINP